MAESATQDEATDAIAGMWQRLARLRRFSFLAEPGPESLTGWRGQGDGRIDMRMDAGDWLLIEQGSFLPAGTARHLSLRNVYRWQRTGCRLRLYHERFGTDASVYLFDLVATDRRNLVCRRPHLCGDDDYRGSIRLTGNGFDLNWSISGPRKDEHLFYRYGMR